MYILCCIVIEMLANNLYDVSLYLDFFVYQEHELEDEDVVQIIKKVWWYDPERTLQSVLNSESVGLVYSPL